MRTLTLIIILVTSFKVAFSQSIDSTAYYWYINDVNFDSVFYDIQYYRNGSIKEEGWYVRNSNSNQYFKIYNPNNEFDYVDTKVGYWKSYYKNGKIEFSMKIPKSFQDTIHLVKYDKKGSILLKSKRINKTEFNPYQTKNSGNLRNQNNLEYYYAQYFIGGKVYREGQLIGDWKKHGYWLFFDSKGDLKKRKLFDNGKQIKIPAANNGEHEEPL